MARFGRNGPDDRTGVAALLQQADRLAVMQRRIADMITAHQFVLPDHIHLGMSLSMQLTLFLPV